MKDRKRKSILTRRLSEAIGINDACLFTHISYYSEERRLCVEEFGERVRLLQVSLRLYSLENGDPSVALGSGTAPVRSGCGCIA